MSGLLHSDPVLHLPFPGIKPDPDREARTDLPPDGLEYLYQKSRLIADGATVCVLALVGG